MAGDRPQPPDGRTYSVEEVGRLIRRASAEGARAPAATADHDRLSWDEVREIAADVGISESALARAAAETPAETPPEPGAPAAAPAPVTPQGVEPRGAGLGVELAVAATLVAMAGAGDAVFGFHGFLFLAAAGVGALAVGGRALYRALRGLAGEGPRAPDGGAPADHRVEVTFASSTVDLTHVPEGGPDPYVVQVNVRFGDAVVVLDPAIPHRIETSVVFGEARLPDPGRRPPTPPGPPRLVVRLRVVFGNARVTFLGQPSIAERLITAFTGRR